MGEGESIFDSIYEDDSFEDADEDVEMVDVEEGELVEHNSQPDLGQSSGVDANVGNQESQNKKQNKKRRRKANKNKNKRQKGGLGSNVTNLDRFVIDTCRRLKERKSYMVYTALGCLGFSALSDLVNEVYAIQACGGQMTADGRRQRTGGGILWGIIKARAPTAYKEIMKKGNEFERQFRQQNIRQAPEQNKESCSQETACAFADGTLASVPEGSLLTPQNQHEQPSAEGKRKSVHDRIRVPVSYDDLLGDDPKNDSM